MATTLAIPSRTAALSLRDRVDTDAILAWLLPLALVTYLGLRGGGYDQIITGQVAIAAWWLIFLVAAFRLATIATSRAGWAWLGLLFAYAAWTTLSLIWTVSGENTMINVSLMALYCGVAVLAMALRGPNTARHMLNALGVAIVAIAAIAVLSRLRFEWFAAPQTAQFLKGSLRRLSYPLNYWNALAALVVMGIPVLLHAATGARTLAARALAAAAIPLLALTTFLTVSRGGAIAVVIGLVVFVLLAPDRFPKLLVIAVTSAGSALLIAAANQRAAVRNGLRTALAHHQGNQLLTITVVVMIAVGLLVAALALAERHLERPQLLLPTRRRTTTVSASVLLVAVIVFALAGGPGFLSREWRQFKSPVLPTTSAHANSFQRLQSVAGEGRYQYWQSAAKAAKLDPWTGTGAGTFVYWWAQHGTISGGYVRDAHSLYLQSLGELGYPGLLLSIAVIAWILLAGIARVIRGRDPTQRLAIAAATAAATVFAFSASVEWIWLIPVLPVTLIILATVIFSPGPDQSAPDGGNRTRVIGFARIIGPIGALAVIAAVALPMSATAAVRNSQSLVAANKLVPALDQALDAEQIQPYAASPWLQEALVLEEAGDLPDALIAAQHATARELTNWQPWFVLSRLEARTGHTAAALADYRRAVTLDPRNPLFQP
jgi:hypothetical protein